MIISAKDEETIIALCTPQGSGALALLRISGSHAFDVAQKITKLSGNKTILNVASHTINAGWITTADNQKIIDRVMVIVMKGPATFTGQDTVEITCHNNPFIIQAIIQKAIQQGARAAQHGEFSRRAYLNGKIDLLQAEAINELIAASTQEALDRSLAQMNGSFSSWIADIEKSLTKCLAFSEASFEFIDESMEFAPVIKQVLEKILQQITSLKKKFDQQNTIRKGFRIALLGTVNAGKSSLFNMLLEQKRAIVTPIAGTTRDSIEAGLYKDGAYITFIDTAGLRETDDSIEQEGIQRSFKEGQIADIILLVYDTSRVLNNNELAIYQKLYEQWQSKIIMIGNKIDLGSKQDPLFCEKNTFVSSNKPESIHALHEQLNIKIKALSSGADCPFLLNKRHFNALMHLENNLLNIIAMLQEPVAYELVSYHLQDSLESLTQLTGKTISEQAMDAIFNEFCVGK